MTVSRASLCGRRRASGVTSGPIASRSVATATAARVIHGSATARTGARYSMWSQTKKPSQPRLSARAARAATAPGSDSSSKGAT